MTTPPDDDPKKVDRREWLATVGAGVAGAAVLGACDDPASSTVQPDAATDTAPDAADVSSDGPPPDVGAAPALKPVRGDGSHPFHYIDTVVIVQMENRSFDMYFSSLANDEGRGDILAAPPGWSNPDLNGNPILARKLDTEFVVHPDPGHGQSASLTQWANGANDGFVVDWQPKLGSQYADRLDWVMGYHTRDQLPAHYGLADGFALFDHWHCALLGPTWPNRFYSHAASSGGWVSNSQTVSLPTPYADILAAGNSVGIYHENTLYFPLLISNFPHDSVPKYGPDQESDVGGLIDFVAHAEAGTLPNVCIVEPDFNTADDHPPADVRMGQAFIATVYDALRNSPQWDRCLMLLFYDEHGGFADSVAPPDAVGEVLAGQDPGKNFTKLGFRVPGLAIGPLVKRGQVVHDVIEHSSVPRLLRDIFTPDAPYVNSRAEMAGDLGACLDIELTLDANRPMAPILPQVELPQSKVEFAQRQPFGQAELAAAALRHYGMRPLSYERLRRKNDRWLRYLDQRRLARIL